MRELELKKMQEVVEEERRATRQMESQNTKLQRLVQTTQKELASQLREIEFKNAKARPEHCKPCAVLCKSCSGRALVASTICTYWNCLSFVNLHRPTSCHNPCICTTTGATWRVVLQDLIMGVVPDHGTRTIDGRRPRRASKPQINCMGREIKYAD